VFLEHSLHFVSAYVPDVHRTICRAHGDEMAVRTEGSARPVAAHFKTFRAGKEYVMRDVLFIITALSTCVYIGRMSVVKMVVFWDVASCGLVEINVDQECKHL
jgi:hypothetical protein